MLNARLSTTRTRSFLFFFLLHPKTPNFLAHAPPIRFDRGGGRRRRGARSSADPSVSNTSMYLAYNGLVIDSATRKAQNTARHARARFVPRWCRASRACADAVDDFASLACARASEWLRSCAPLGVDPRSGRARARVRVLEIVVLTGRAVSPARADAPRVHASATNCGRVDSGAEGVSARGTTMATLASTSARAVIGRRAKVGGG